MSALNFKLKPFILWVFVAGLSSASVRSEDCFTVIRRGIEIRDALTRSFLKEKISGIERNAEPDFEYYNKFRSLFSDEDPRKNSSRSYDIELGRKFIPFLTNLEPQGLWIDGGIGSGRAIYDYLAYSKATLRTPVRVVGIADKLTPSHFLNEAADLAPAGKLDVVIGKKLEEVQEIFPSSATLVTDVYGPISYTEKVDQVLFQYLRWLKKGGRLYFATGATLSHFSYVGPSKNDQTFQPRDYVDFFSLIKGIKIVFAGDRQEAYSNFVLERTDGPLEVPQLILRDPIRYLNRIDVGRSYDLTGQILR